MPDTPLTTAAIATHERLYPRLAALLKQVERVAGRRAGAPAPEETVRLARELCREAAKLLGRDGRGIGVPNAAAPAPPKTSSRKASARSPASGSAPGLDHAGLAIALGQALAGLEAFEAAHSGWSAARKCVVWAIDGPPQPVLRLLPPGSPANAVQAHDPVAEAAKRDLIKLIISRYAAGYDDGYRQASEGKPPSARYAEEAWDGLVEKARDSDETARLRELHRRYGSVNPPSHLLPVGAVLSDPKKLEP